MGLDITAYSNIKKTDATLNEDGEAVDTNGCVIEDSFVVRINPDFPQHATDLTDDAVYGYDDSMSFRAGSYMGYGMWRDNLAKIAGYGADPEATYLEHVNTAWKHDTGPFSELLNFSDCEGFIGAEVSKKLAKDFADFDEKAKESSDLVYQRYDLFKQAFEMAANNGAVKFH